MAEKQDKDIQKVKEWIELMKENDLLELEIADGQGKIHIKRPGTQGQSAVPPAPAVGPQAPAGNIAEKQTAGATEDGLVEIKSPIVGTFYAAASPDGEPYVTQGTQVEQDTVVCIVEAMKVMNEIKAETAGKIVRLCCKDGQSVQYGQTLFLVRP